MSVVSKAHRNFVFKRRVRVLADHLASTIPENARVLDVGCGDGALAARLMDLRPDLEVTGIDVLVRPETRIPVEAFDGKSIGYSDNSFDAVLFVDVLHHTDDPAVLLAEAMRVARRAVIVKDHLADAVLARTTLRFMDWVGNAHHGVALPYNYWPEALWKSALSQLGARIDTWRTKLGLYPSPASWLFDRSLHFIARIVPPDAPSPPAPALAGDRS